MDDRIRPFPKNRQWLLLSGILTLILGIFAIIVPLRASLVFEVGIGMIFIIVGLIQASHSFWARGWGGFYFEALGGVLYLLVGIMLLGNPGAGVQMVTLMLALLLIMQGMVQISLSSELQSRLSKVWMFISGAAAIFLGVLTWKHWPSDALWLIGLFVGIHLLLRGFSIVGLALSGDPLVRKPVALPAPEMA